MIIALAITAYLLAVFQFARRWRADHPGWHWAPVLIAALAWPYLLALRIVALLRARGDGLR